MKQADVLFTNACVLTMDEKRRVLYDATVAVKGDKIAEIGGADLAKEYEGKHTVDLTGRVLLPGFISTHSHLFQTLLKGLGRDRHLMEWLNASIRVAQHNFDADMIYWAAMEGCLEAIKSGTTTILDYMYCHPQEGLDDMVTKAFEDIGIRGILGRSYSNTAKYPPEIACENNDTEQTFLDETIRLTKKYEGHSRISTALAPGIIWDHTDDGFREMRKIADEFHIPITLHIVETPDDDAFSNEHYGEDAIPHLEKTGVFGPDFIAVHCVNMTDRDFKIFKNHEVKISHNPLSNMILASGVPPIARFVEEGFVVSLACDGSASNDTQNYLDGLKMASLLQKVYTKDPEVVPAAKALEMATLGGAEAIGRLQDLGSVEVGKKADLIVFNPHAIFSAPAYDPVTALVYASSPQSIESVMIDGNLVMENGVLPNVDEERIRHMAFEEGARLVKKSGLGNIEWGQKMKILPWK